ncbi:MAG: glutamine-hydrolyzing carbamoyl-phosphate synthase small subunit [Ignavibacteriae bacterium]|nr:glutamine-hydrolyzing carbamoyl-phosphate synthase small subunit [Ignavibacteriota bacterium]
MTKRKPNQAKLILEDGSIFFGNSFGSEKSVAGEVVFNTGMVGYPESLTDPSYTGQILTLTYPLIGNYGVPSNQIINNISQNFESEKIRVTGLLVADYSHKHSHWNAEQSLSEWLIEHRVPALSGIDTRTLTQKLREEGTMLGKIVFENDEVEFEDPNQRNLVAEVSTREPQLLGKGKYRVVLVDCGCKHNIIRSFIKRKIEVLRVPWNTNLDALEYDGLFISNGPGDPKQCEETIRQLRKAIKREKPIFGICLGHQLLARAAGANTYKLKYGHRSQNQPVREIGTNKCFVTSQNHGFAVDEQTLPRDWKPLFTNLNDGTNEGMSHKSGKFFSVQFHPEATPGPVDTEFLFDKFLTKVKGRRL